MDIQFTKEDLDFKDKIKKFIKDNLSFELKSKINNGIAYKRNH